MIKLDCKQGCQLHSIS